MSGHKYWNNGTAAATTGTLVDILGDANFTAKQVLITNTHASLTITVGGLDMVNNPSIPAGRSILVVGSTKSLNIIEATSAATYSVNASDSSSPALSYSQDLAATAVIANGAVSEAKLQPANTDNVLLASRSFRCLYDFAVDGGTIGTKALAVTLPEGATVTTAFYKVITTCATAGGDAGTLALGIASDGPDEFVAAIAVSAGGNVWDVSGDWVACSPIGTAASFTSETTAARTIVAVIAVQNFTAGKVLIYGEYIVAE